MNFKQATPSVRNGFRTSHRKLNALRAKIDGRSHSAAVSAMGTPRSAAGTLTRAKAAPSTARRGKTTRR